MKKSFNLGFTLLAASSLLAVSACARQVPMTANNDYACRDSQGNVIDDDYCDNDGGNGGMFLWMSSAGYHQRYGHYPRGYNPKAYAGRKISSTRANAKSYSTFSGRSSYGTTSRGGFGSSGRGFSAGS